MKQASNETRLIGNMLPLASIPDMQSGLSFRADEYGIAATHYGDRTIGGPRKAIARAIYADIQSAETARVWAEVLTGEGQGSLALLRALADVLRECAAEGDEWAEEAMCLFANSPEAVAA